MKFTTYHLASEKLNSRPELFFVVSQSYVNALLSNVEDLAFNLALYCTYGTKLKDYSFKFIKTSSSLRNQLF